MATIREKIRARIIDALWIHHQDLTFGEIGQVSDAALEAAGKEVMKIRRAKFVAIGKSADRAEVTS